MYYFNTSLLSALPELFNMSYSEMSERCGFGVNTIRMWSVKHNMTVAKFVDFLNIFRLSMADFLVLSPDVPVKTDKIHYVIPEEIWNPICWNNENLKTLFGKNSITGVPSKEKLAKSLGFASYAPITKWIAEPYAMTLSTLIRMLNTYCLDANLFIADPNRLIGKPDWETSKATHRSNDSVLAIERELNTLRRQIKERDELISGLKLDIARIERENKSLRSRKPGNETIRDKVADSFRPYGSLFTGKRYVFHQELLENLPEVFGMTQKDFCDRFGLYPAQVSRGNIKMDALIKICNGLHMSISHFFPPTGEPLVVNHRSWYEISKRIFKPISSRMENLKYIFRKTTTGYTLGQFETSTGIKKDGIHSFMEETGKYRMALTVVDVCNSFNLPISVFIDDPNDRKRPAYSFSLNETLIENCVELSKKLERCRKKIKELQDKSENETE